MAGKVTNAIVFKHVKNEKSRQQIYRSSCKLDSKAKGDKDAGVKKVDKEEEFVFLKLSPKA